MRGKHGCWLQIYDRISGRGFALFGVVHPAQLLQECKQEGQGHQEGEHIRDGLADLHAEQPVGAGQDEMSGMKNTPCRQQARKVARPDAPTLWKVMLATTMMGCSSMARHW